jgi:hypothetical protein
MIHELTQNERDVLLEVLKERLGELREQVYHASTPLFKDELKEREAVIRRLIAKFGAAEATCEPVDYR